MLWNGKTPSAGTGVQWYLSEGRLYNAADLSFTFHIISYRRGEVDYWPEIVGTTFAIAAFSDCQAASLG